MAAFVHKLIRTSDVKTIDSEERERERERERDGEVIIIIIITSPWC